MAFQEQLMLAVATSILGYLFAEKRERNKYDREMHKAKKEKEQLYDNVSRVILHELIMNKCEKLLHQEVVTLDEYEDLLALNEPYKALNGNGTAAAAIKKVTIKLGIKGED